MMTREAYITEPIDWTVAPLRHVQFWALRSTAAAKELARRYTLPLTTYSGAPPSAVTRGKLIRAWLAGWRNEPAPVRNSNFDAPVRNAYAVGRTKRRELEQEIGGAQ